MKMFEPKLIFVLCAIFAYCESFAIEDRIKKCKLVDSACQKDMFIDILQNIGDDGIPEMNIPAIDPYKLQNVEIMIMGLLKLTMMDGLAKGFKSCKINKYNVDTGKLVVSVELLCDKYDVDTSYKLESTSTLETLLGGIKIHGEGKSGGVSIDKLQLDVTIPIEVKKLEDSELHFVINTEGVSYTFKILNKIVFHADKFYAGTIDINDVALSIINENWEFFTNTFAKSIFDTVVNTIMKYFNKLFTAIPVKDLISDDVSSYESR